MADEVDRFPELAEAVREYGNRERIKSLAVGAVEQQRTYMMGKLRDNSPIARPDTYVDTGHSHTTIIEGWEHGESFATGTSVGTTINNRSEHIDVQRSGTQKKGYPIPSGASRKPRRPGGLIQTYGKGQVRFWLGPPLKWPVRSARFRKAGFVSLDQVTHPGFEPWGGRDFVEVAADSGRPELIKIFSEEMGHTYKPLEEFFD